MRISFCFSISSLCLRHSFRLVRVRKLTAHLIEHKVSSAEHSSHLSSSFLIRLNLITPFSNIGAIMRNKSNPQQSASNPPLPAAEANTQEQESKSKQLVLIEARVRE